MTSLAVKQRADPPATRPLAVSHRVKAAIAAMVWQGLNRREAAQAANLTEHALYVAFRKPHVKAYYLAELDVLRTSERSRNIHRLCEIRDHSLNMPAVNAIKALEQIADDPAASSAARQAPGVVIVIQNGAGPSDRAVTINAPDIRTDKDE